jgi:outer membrane protein
MRFRGCIVVLSAIASLAAAASPAWADLKIGVVQYSRLMQESPQGKAAQDALRNEFSNKQKELQGQQQALKSKEDSYQRDSATMTGDQRTQMEKELREGNRQLSLRVNEYQDDFNARQNEELSKLQKTLVEEVQAYAQAQKFDLVLGDNGVLYAGQALDITPQILSALQARGPRAATPAASAPSASGTTGTGSKGSAPPK